MTVTGVGYREGELVGRVVGIDRQQICRRRRCGCPCYPHAIALDRDDREVARDRRSRVGKYEIVLLQVGQGYVLQRDANA